MVAPEARPLERVLGPELGDLIRGLHEEHGVVFHLGQKAAAVAAGDGHARRAASGSPPTWSWSGIGVRPNLELAEAAGLAARPRRGASTSGSRPAHPGIFAAGDIARWPDPHTGERIRVEHWVVAQRQGQAAARNILGLQRALRRGAVLLEPALRRGDQLRGARGALGPDRGRRRRRERRTARCGSCGRAGHLAVATMGRDRESLEAEAAMEGAGGAGKYGTRAERVVDSSNALGFLRRLVTPRASCSGGRNAPSPRPMLPWRRKRYTGGASARRRPHRPRTSVSSCSTPVCASAGDRAGRCPSARSGTDSSTARARVVGVIHYRRAEA